jgi:hypothetical protein
MPNKFRITVLMLLLGTVTMAQQPDKTHLRIVDTLTPLEKTSRNPVILRSELDSLIKLHNDLQAQLQLPVQKPLQEVKDYSQVFFTWSTVTSKKSTASLRERVRRKNRFLLYL